MESRHRFPYSPLRLFNSCSRFSIPWYFQLEPQFEVRDYSEPKCFGEQEKSIHYKCIICTSYCEYRFSALSLRHTGQCHQPQPPLAVSHFSQPPAGMTGCTGHRRAPWNFSSTSSPTRASQPRTYEIWTKQPLCHIEDAVLCSFN